LRHSVRYKGSRLEQTARELADPTAASFEEIAGPYRGRPLSMEQLERVAAVYLDAWGKGLPVTAAVADHFCIAKSTAAKRIMAARKAGLLDSAKRITR
jgi:hypothetical protein